MEPAFDALATKSIGAAMRKRDTVLTIVAALMIIFGIAEVIVGFQHTFVRTTHISVATCLRDAMGVSYVFAGTLILTRKKTAAAVALCLLAAVILGQVAMVVSGVYPTDSVPQLFVIILRTSIACSFLVVVALKWEAQ
jgi:uncharacterized membrane protein